MAAAFVNRTLSGLAYTASTDRLTGENGTFTFVLIGDRIRILNTGAGEHITTGIYTVDAIDTTNYSYIELSTSADDGSDDTGVAIELIKFEDAPQADRYQTGVDYNYGDCASSTQHNFLLRIIWVMQSFA